MTSSAEKPWHEQRFEDRREEEKERYKALRAERAEQFPTVEQPLVAYETALLEVSEIIASTVSDATTRESARSDLAKHLAFYAVERLPGVTTLFELANSLVRNVVGHEPYTASGIPQYRPTTSDDILSAFRFMKRVHRFAEESNKQEKLTSAEQRLGNAQAELISALVDGHSEEEMQRFMALQQEIAIALRASQGYVRPEQL